MSILNIRSAIEAELAATPEYYDFKVKETARDDHLLRVTVDPSSIYVEGSHTSVVLDDSFDGASAWWAGTPNGNAKVLTVIPEDDQIILCHVMNNPPQVDKRLRLYPPRYLEALQATWQDKSWAQPAFDCLSQFNKVTRAQCNPLSGHAFPWLRRAQLRALDLVSFANAFLWGPPGTGKTTTLGVLLAEYLHLNPRARVLLLSTTNHAIDEATVAVDKALERVRRYGLRNTVKRIGTRFIASNYANREHLLPVLDHDLISRLARLEGQRPASSDIAAYSSWVELVEALRTEIRCKSIEVLNSSRLASMTTTRALFSLGELRQIPSFDLVVFDEASQVSLASALALMPLGHSCIFAGDPKQLSPVVRSSHPYAQTWLSRSPFAVKSLSGASVCLLDEQSRMAGPICQVVSQVFYQGKLKVAEEVKSDQDWLSDRKLTFGPIGDNEHVSVQHVNQPGTWSQHYHGPIRYESAELIAGLVKSSSISLPTKAIVVITPFRAQRALLRQRLSAQGVRNIKVSTVHRVQGSEAPVVIFDPVDGVNHFLMNEESQRLINVALSRAQAKIIVYLSDQDCGNPVFSQISNIVKGNHDQRLAIPIHELALEPNFPMNTKGKLVAIAQHTGEVVRIDLKGGYLWILNRLTGCEQGFSIEIIHSNALARKA